SEAASLGAVEYSRAMTHGIGHLPSDFSLPPQVFLGEVPMDHSPERIEISCPGITVVDVVCVLPNVAGENRLHVLGHRIRGIAGRDHVERTITFSDQPRPSRAEVTHCNVAEVFYKFRGAAERFPEGVGHCPFGFSTALG